MKKERYATANNKCMSHFNAKQIISYLMYIDANNLYGYAMIKKLQINSFKWIDDLKRFTSEFIKNYDIDSDTGYLLEVDIKKKKKESYVVHIQALKQALLHGLELKKVYRVISFRQTT